MIYRNAQRPTPEENAASLTRSLRIADEQIQCCHATIDRQRNRIGALEASVQRTQLYAALFATAAIAASLF